MKVYIKYKDENSWQSVGQDREIDEVGLSLEYQGKILNADMIQSSQGLEINHYLEINRYISLNSGATLTIHAK